MVTQKILRTFQGKKVFLVKKNIRFVTALDLIKCLNPSTHGGGGALYALLFFALYSKGLHATHT